MKQCLIRNPPGSDSCDVSILLVRKITMGIHSWKPRVGPSFNSCDEVPQKSRSLPLTIQSYERFFLQNAGVHQNTCLHASPTARKFAFLTSVLLCSYSTSFSPNHLQTKWCVSSTVNQICTCDLMTCIFDHRDWLGVKYEEPVQLVPVLLLLLHEIMPISMLEWWCRTPFQPGMSIVGGY